MAMHPLSLSALRTYQSAGKARLAPYPVADAAFDYAGAVEFQESEPAGLYASPCEMVRRSMRAKARDLLAVCRRMRRDMAGGAWRGEGPPMALAAAQADLWKARDYRRAFYDAAADHAIAAIESALDVSGEAEPDAPAMASPYSVANFPHFVCHHGNWDIWANGSGYCASIPTAHGAAIGCKATHFGDLAYVRATLGVTVMVPQVAQQPQAKARGPARGERRYVTVRDTETGEVHRVLTSVARVGAAVIIFTPSNRHRQGAIGGMLIIHDDVRKAWVFNDESEARRMLSRNRAPGERTIRAELIADPAQ
jgi:hypothetical protein